VRRAEVNNKVQRRCTEDWLTRINLSKNYSKIVAAMGGVDDLKKEGKKRSLQKNRVGDSTLRERVNRRKVRKKLKYGRSGISFA